MTRIRLRGRDDEIEARADETLLDALLRGGVSVDNSCRAGICRSCEVRVSAGEVDAGTEAGAVRDDRVLACSVKPCGDLVEVDLGDAVERVSARLVERSQLAPTVLRLRFHPEGPFAFEPGQFAMLYGPGGRARPYSIASQPEDGFVELHVRRVPEGLMSSWLFDVAELGAEVSFGLPEGDCVYRARNEDEPLLLVGIGTGLAPLWGILHRARARGHRGTVILVQGAADADRLYLHEELRELASQWDAFSYRAAVLSGGAGRADVVEKDVGELAAELVPELRGWRAHIAGDPEMVKRLQRELVVAGLSPFSVHADAFVPAST
jgi:CDP-4-dehydro-6-deoxyglucose reductase, E3